MTDIQDRVSAKEWIANTSIFYLDRKSIKALPTNKRALVDLAYSMHWVDDEGTIGEEQWDATKSALNDLYPVTPTASRPKLKSSKGCYRCDGTGYIKGFEHIHNGRCFACNS